MNDQRPPAGTATPLPANSPEQQPDGSPVSGKIPRQLPAKIHRLHTAILAGFLAVTLALVFWSVIRAPAILARDDNPRLVEAELRLVRGRILDRNEQVLADTGGAPQRRTRVYPIAAGPAVGYYSFRHGATGVEESYNTLLRGDSDDFWADYWRQNLHQPQVGRDVRLTLDAAWQVTADALFAGRQGALLLLSLPDAGATMRQAEILALASQPGYDPNRLDELFEELIADETAPLLNRVTQGQYQPGLVVQPLLIAAALDQGLIGLADPVAAPNRPLVVNGLTLGCDEPPPLQATWADVLRLRCPAPMQDLAARLTAAGLNEIFAGFGLAGQPDVPLNTAVTGYQPVADPALAAIGQETLTVTPLQVGLALAALGTDGRLPDPKLVAAVQDETGAWQPVDDATTAPTVVTAATARDLRRALLRHQDVLEYSLLVLSGPEQATNGWYLGLAPATAPRYAVVVVVEETMDVTAAQAIGRGLLAAVSQQQ